jgi:hypothetical protein
MIQLAMSGVLGPNQWKAASTSPDIRTQSRMTPASRPVLSITPRSGGRASGEELVTDYRFRRCGRGDSEESSQRPSVVEQRGG